LNVNDIPTLAPYFFIEPDLKSDEARSMIKSVSGDDYSKALFFCIDIWLNSLYNRYRLATRCISVGRFANLGRAGNLPSPPRRSICFADEAEDVYDHFTACSERHKGADALYSLFTSKLIACKTGPSVSEIMHTLGQQRSIARLVLPPLESYADQSA
jgi:hypothetical protein